MYFKHGYLIQVILIILITSISTLPVSAQTDQDSDPWASIQFTVSNWSGLVRINLENLQVRYQSSSTLIPVVMI